MVKKPKPDALHIGQPAYDENNQATGLHPEAIFCTDAKGNIISLNHTAHAYFDGLSPQININNVANLIGTGTNTPYNITAVKTEAIFTALVPLADGVKHRSNVIITALYNHKQQLSGYNVRLTPTKAFKVNTPAAFFNTDRFVKTITDNLPAMMAYYSADLRCMFANLPYRLHFGKPDENIIGKFKHELMDAAEYSAHEVQLKHVLAGHTQSFERNFTDASGKTIYTHTQYVPDVHNGAITGFFSIIYDVSDVIAAQTEANRQAVMANDLLDHISDTFISLDHELRYIHVNNAFEKLTGILPQTVIGKTVLEVFPDVENTPTYQAMLKAHAERQYICNEDYYAPLNLWQENRIYPTDLGISIFIRDISDRKEALEKLRYSNERFALISKATNDGLFEWNLVSNKVWWSESHFTMFGFDPNEPIPEQDVWLACLHPDFRHVFANTITDIYQNNLRTWNREVAYFRPDKSWGTLLNRGFVVTDDHNHPVRILGSFIEITDRKNEEIKQKLITRISSLFKTQRSTNNILQTIATLLLKYTDCAIAELWLVSADKQNIVLKSKSVANDDHKAFFYGNQLNSFTLNQGLPGQIWATGTTVFWPHQEHTDDFLRFDKAQRVNLQSSLGIPITYNNEVIGAVLLHFTTPHNPIASQQSIFDALGTHLGNEITYHQIEEHYKLLFDNAPDLICVVGGKEHFVNVNPAMSNLLGYSREELLSRPVESFLHPDDVASRSKRLVEFKNGLKTTYFENRYISKEGKIIWMAWTAHHASDDGLLFCVGKNITEKKELEELLRKTNEMAKIGSWAFDLVDNHVYWSDNTAAIYEVPEDYVPSIEKALNFFTEGDDNRTRLIDLYNHVVQTGVGANAEGQITTYTGNTKWVRVIAETEVNNGVCTSVFGSFQDITETKEAELKAFEALKQRDNILESIGEAFFAVDRDWNITYWNAAAEKTMGRSRDEVLDHNLWDMFPAAVVLESYRQYYHAMNTGEAVHFEDYYPPMETWFGVSAYPSANGLSVFFTDITQQKNATKALEDSERRYADLFQLNPQPLFVYNFDTLQILDANTAAAAHYGYTFDEFIGLSILDMRLPEERDLLDNTMAEIRKQGGGARHHGIYRHKKKNGEIMQIEVNTNAINYNGINARLVLANDVTERFKYIAALEESEHRYSNLFHLSPMPLYVFNRASLQFLDVNQAAIDQYGFTYDEFMGMTILEIRPPEEIAHALQAIANDAGQTGSTHHGTYIHRKKNGDIINVDASSNVIDYKGVEAKIVLANDVTERFKYIAALEESEHRYSNLFELSPMPLYLHDPKTYKFLDVNQAAIEHYGYTYNEFMYMTILDIRPPEEVQRVKKAIADDEHQTGTLHQGIYKHRKKNGDIIEVDIRTNVIDYKGIKAKLVLANDVTDRVKYIAALEESERRYSDLFQLSPIPIMIHNRETLKIMDVNRAAVLNYGYTHDEFLTLRAPDMLPPADVQAITTEVEKYSGELGAKHPGVFRHQKKCGEIIRVDIQTNTINFKGADAKMVLANDVTERFKYISALEESEHRYSDLFQLSPLPLWVYDMETLKFLDVNQAAIAHYGYTYDEFMNLTIRDVRPPEDIPLMEQTITELQDQNGIKKHGVFRHIKKNGQIIHVDIQSNIIDYKGIKAKLVLLIDITENIKYIKAIERQNAKLKEISWIQSHVVRAPLSRIMGLVQLIDGEVPDKKDQQDIREYILESAHELDDAIKRITQESITLEGTTTSGFD